jgi:hypothetical protein
MACLVDRTTLVVIFQERFNNRQFQLVQIFFAAIGAYDWRSNGSYCIFVQFHSIECIGLFRM